MLDSESLYVWRGERRLLPTGQAFKGQPRELILRCLRGRGYLRIMSQSNRLLLAKGHELRIPGGEIATISGSQNMMIELKPIKKQDSS